MVTGSIEESEMIITACKTSVHRMFLCFYVKLGTSYCFKSSSYIDFDVSIAAFNSPRVCHVWYSQFLGAFHEDSCYWISL
jgi:hypothetical protein